MTCSLVSQVSFTCLDDKSKSRHKVCFGGIYMVTHVHLFMDFKNNFAQLLSWRVEVPFETFFHVG